ATPHPSNANFHGGIAILVAHLSVERPPCRTTQRSAAAHRLFEAVLQTSAEARAYIPTCTRRATGRGRCRRRPGRNRRAPLGARGGYICVRSNIRPKTTATHKSARCGHNRVAACRC